MHSYQNFVQNQKTPQQTYQDLRLASALAVHVLLPEHKASEKHKFDAAWLIYTPTGVKTDKFSEQHWLRFFAN